MQRSVFALREKRYEDTEMEKKRNETKRKENKKKKNVNSRKIIISGNRAKNKRCVYHTGKNTRVSHYNDVQRAHARPTHNSIVEGIPCLLEDLASS